MVALRVAARACVLASLAAPVGLDATTASAQGASPTSVEVSTLWTADNRRLRSLRLDFLDALDDPECGNLELADIRDEYISTLNGLIDSYSGLLVDATPAVRSDIGEIIDTLVADREEALKQTCPAPVEYVRVCDAYGTGFFYIPGTESCLRIEGEVRYEFLSVPTVETGTIILGPGGPDDERALNTSEEWIDGFGTSFGFEFGTGRWTNRFSAGYGKADGGSYSEEPAGGRPVAITYFGPAVSTGIALGATGASVRSTVDAESIEFDYTGLLNVPLQGRFGLRFGPSISYRHFEQNHSSDLRSLTFADVFSETDQTASENQYGAGARLEALFPLSQRFGLHGGVAVRGVFGSTELDTRQVTTCGACPVGQQFVEIDLEDSEDWFDIDTSFNLGGTFVTDGGLTFFVDMQVDLTPRSEIDNPENPAQDDTHLQRSRATDISVRAGLRYAFGAPPPPPP